jgi:hypothetical protein
LMREGVEVVTVVTVVTVDAVVVAEEGGTA